jgi:membrane fusion protein (multidrug efflux system)
VGITRDPKGNGSALIVNKDGKVEARTVLVSRTVGDQWLVDEGLSSGDRLIVEGLQKVQPDMTVQAVEQTAGADNAGGKG